MKRFVLLALIFFAAPAWADLPQTLRLDRRITPAALPGYVQVLYTDAQGYMALRMRVQEPRKKKPETLCVVLRPSSYAPQGVPSNEWVPAGDAIAATPSYGTQEPNWSAICAKP